MPRKRGTCLGCMRSIDARALRCRSCAARERAKSGHAMMMARARYPEPEEPREAEISQAFDVLAKAGYTFRSIEAAE